MVGPVAEQVRARRSRAKRAMLGGDLQQLGWHADARYCSSPRARARSTYITSFYS